MLTRIWFLQRLLDCAWATANWADIAEQLGHIVEIIKKLSQQNLVADHHGHLVVLGRVQIES